MCVVVRCKRIDFQQVTAKVCDALGPFLWNVKADGNTIFQVDIFWWPSFRFCSTEWKEERARAKEKIVRTLLNAHDTTALCCAPLFWALSYWYICWLCSLSTSSLYALAHACAPFFDISAGLCVVGTFCASINSTAAIEAAALGRMPEPDQIENRKMITIEINAWLIDPVLLMFASFRYAMCVRWKKHSLLKRYWLTLGRTHLCAASMVGCVLGWLINEHIESSHTMTADLWSLCKRIDGV